MTSDKLKTLNYIDEGEWDKAHQLIQSYSDKISCLIHAHLHRIEGDLSNANYWYGRAGSVAPDNTLEEDLKLLFQLVNAESE